ncbi:MAG: hypothetical protein Q8O95_05930 [bacterium]|nr:hypothetical protein [bacterium]
MQHTGRKIISATIASSFVLWLDQTSANVGIPKSRLLEEGLRLLRQKMDHEQKSSFRKQLNEGIDRILLSGEDQIVLAEPPFDELIGEEII